MKGYYVPNRVSNEYVDSKRNEQGAYEYDTYLQDVGMNTQAAIQSLNKDYSSAINNAYSQYLNSKYTIANSDMIQGAKDAYLQKQQEALHANVAQASLTAAETKQQILQQAYEQQNAIGEAFQTEVNNMEQVGTMLSGYMEYLKGVTNGSGSYYDAIISGKGLNDYTGDIYAEDLYDELYNAQPGLKDNMYTDKEGNAALGWTDWLNTQIKTDKQQQWYDWYMGQGGYEQFQDAYKKGIYTTDESGAGAYLAEQKKKRDYEAAKSDAEEKYKIEKYNAEQDYNAKRSAIDEQMSDINLQHPRVFLGSGDYGHIDLDIFGFKSADTKIRDTKGQVESYIKSLGLTDDDLKQLGYGSANEIIESVVKAGRLLNDGYTLEEVFASGKGFNEGFKRFMNTLDKTMWKSFKQESTQRKVEAIYNEIMLDLYKQAQYKKAGVMGDFKYDKEFTFASYEDYYK